jgi:hypothetical protein
MSYRHPYAKPDTNLKEDVIDDKLIFLKKQNEFLLEQNNKYENDILSIASVMGEDDHENLPYEVSMLIEEIDILRSQLNDYQKVIITITTALRDHLP